VGGGGNLSFDDGGCPGTFLSGDPQLGPLTDDGGPTWTTALGPGSAAIDAAADSVCGRPSVRPPLGPEAWVRGA
jgi:hypothetical protein